MRMSSPAFVTVGEVAGAFGIAGEMKVDVLTDVAERFAVGRRLFLQGSAVTVERARAAGLDRVVVKLSGIETREEAAAFRGFPLEVPMEEVPPLPSGSYYRFQLLGLEAWTDDGSYLGVVEEVFPTGSNDVLVVRGPDRLEVLIPNTSEIADIDLESRRLTVRVVPGLLPGTRARPAAASRRMGRE